MIKKKYLFFLLFAPLILGEAALQAGYFLQLKPDLITSCCGTLFSRETGYLPTEILFAPRIPAMVAFYVVTAATVGSGLFTSWKGKGGYLFSGLSLLTFVVSLFAILSFVSLYIYELPTHHCPFCILQKEYGYIGYPLYVALFGGTILGLGVGALMPFRNIKSLSRLLPGVQRRLALISSVLFAIFAGLVTVRILLSNLALEGY